ncbi:hypothetical protein BCR36DRAFT_415063 [Piromyces finnis]|uniref:Shugoshin C-terminal domain-containing protein n=1 Tax=Piromyces finnis TaxID=1754191 RepID=A0A1Y1UZT9_9FUNG|nr:hypothetical protein BCR36DRAFT_415063 [Piromyces finnis]|eukprot:ORX44307.1 hypothetical protein BCR36DRAFT_415063 [Piromyces finnis]
MELEIYKAYEYDPENISYLTLNNDNSSSLSRRMNKNTTKDYKYNFPQKVSDYNESSEISYDTIISEIEPESIQLKDLTNFSNKNTILSDTYNNDDDHSSSNSNSKFQEPTKSIVNKSTTSSKVKIIKKNIPSDKKEIYIENSDDLPIVIKKNDLKHVSSSTTSFLSSSSPSPSLSKNSDDQDLININLKENFNKKKRGNEYTSKSHTFKKTKSSFIIAPNTFDTINKPYYNSNNKEDDTDYSICSDSSNDSIKNPKNHEYDKIVQDTKTMNRDTNESRNDDLFNTKKKDTNKKIKNYKNNQPTKKTNPTVKSSSLKKNKKKSQETNIKIISSISSLSNKNKNKNVLSKILISPYKSPSHFSSNKENINPNRRSHRHKNVVNYTLPSIRSKLRRGDKDYGCGIIRPLNNPYGINTFSHKEKENKY